MTKCVPLGTHAGHNLANKRKLSLASCEWNASISDVAAFCLSRSNILICVVWEQFINQQRLQFVIDEEFGFVREGFDVLHKSRY